MAPTKPSKKSPSSNKLTHGIARVKGENFYRDAKKAARVKMLAGGKPVRDKAGNIIKAADFQKGEEFAKPGRVQPDRRWFGNTRVISQDALEHFRNSLSVKKDDPYTVLLRRNKLPMSLLDDSSVGQKRPHIVETEPFGETFGPNAQRKKPRIDVGTFEELSLVSKDAGDAHEEAEDEKAIAEEKQNDTSVAGGGFLGSSFATSLLTGPSKPKGWTAHGAMSAIHRGYNPLVEPVFSKGTSRRIYGELYKVIDSSDVIIHVLDARDPLGTLCSSVVDYVRKEKSHKQVVYLINKVDLVPSWVTQRYIAHLTPQAPTLAFHASQTHSFGKGALIQLLRQFSQLHSDRKQISVGFVGYPNVGKSSIINCLKAGKVCNVAPIPGETKVWQYITLMRRIYLIDCPGIVPASAHDSQTSKVLKGVVRVENLAIPSEHIPALLQRVRPIYLERTYGVEGLMEKSVKMTALRDDAPDEPIPSDPKQMKWNADAFLDAVARRYGRLLKGGEPDRETAAKMVLNDWIRGNIPFFVRPPDTPEFVKKEADQSTKSGVVIKPKNAVAEVRKEEVEVASSAVAKLEDEEEWNGVVGEGDNGGAMKTWSGSEDEEDEDELSEESESEDEDTVKAKKQAAKLKREGRPLYVQQDFRGIVTRPKFVKDDRVDDVPADAQEVAMGDPHSSSSPEEDISEPEEQPLNWDEVLGAATAAIKADQKDLEEDGNAEGEEEEEAEDITSEEESHSKSEKSKGKQKAVESEDDENETDEGDANPRSRYGKTVKEPRMKTNKRKATNFFTHANVKNRNRDKKIPQAIPVNERGKNGNRKAGGKGGKKR